MDESGTEGQGPWGLRGTRGMGRIVSPSVDFIVSCFGMERQNVVMSHSGSHSVVMKNEDESSRADALLDLSRRLRLRLEALRDLRDAYRSATDYYDDGRTERGDRLLAEAIWSVRERLGSAGIEAPELADEGALLTLFLQWDEKGRVVAPSRHEERPVASVAAPQGTRGGGVLDVASMLDQMLGGER